MTYAALVSLAQTIDKLLSNQDHDQDQDSFSLREKLQIIISTHKHIVFLQGFLEDFPGKASSLEGRIRDAANQAEDILEDFMLEHHRQHHTSKWTAAHESVARWLLPSDDFSKFEKLTEEIVSITGEIMQIKNRAAAQDLQVRDPSSIATLSSSLSSLSNSSLIAPPSKDSLVGFEDDLMAIKIHLCGESYKRQVIPIVGMGGIGKTALARTAYDDQLTVEHFQIRAWVTVSQDYSAQQILSSLLASIKGSNEVREKRGDSPEDAVYKSLKGKRYLIVMDDMWSTKVWDDVRRIFPDDQNGSRIILTTRLSDVAAYPDSSSPLHEMRFMDADQSWNLLRKKVFPQGNCPPELEGIGKMIARNCRGLPLAIIVISGVLSTVCQTRASWENIARNVNEAVTASDEEFAEIILSSSYKHLPHHLRPCLLYMGLFPEDYEIRASKLIKLWVAEGFLKPYGVKSCEEVAEEYLGDLAKRNLVLVTKKSSLGKIKSCSMHDLVRDLCIRKAEQEKFLLRIKGNYVSVFLPESIRNSRRLSMVHSDLNCLKDIYDSHIHTIICVTFNGCKWDCLQNTRLLRVLDVVDKGYNTFEPIFRLPYQVIKLFHLTYLSLPYLAAIPAAISYLENLQTLIIYDHGESTRTITLPFGVWRMQQLRHLVLCDSYRLPDPEGADFPLENLQTLSEVKNLKITEKILQMIPNLKKLGICYLADASGLGFHVETNFPYFDQLEKLTLRTKGFATWLEPVLPTTLKKLTLSGTHFQRYMRAIGSLPYLEVLKLKTYACARKWETKEGEFRQLKFLLIKESGLSDWITESSHFPSLKFLVLEDCWHLSKIPDGIGEISTLELIQVDKWNRSLMGSAKRIQEEQRENWGNDALQVCCMPSGL